MVGYTYAAYAASCGTSVTHDLRNLEKMLSSWSQCICFLASHWILIIEYFIDSIVDHLNTSWKQRFITTISRPYWIQNPDLRDASCCSDVLDLKSFICRSNRCDQTLGPLGVWSTCLDHFGPLRACLQWKITTCVDMFCWFFDVGIWPIWPKRNMVNDLVSNPHPKEVLVKRGKKGVQKAWGPAYPTQVADA